MTNYENLFGTPEKAAWFLFDVIRMMGTDDACDLFDTCQNCPLYDTNIAPKCRADPTGEAVLEWLEAEGVSVE